MSAPESIRQLHCTSSINAGTNSPPQSVILGAPSKMVDLGPLSSTFGSFPVLTFLNFPVRTLFYLGFDVGILLHLVGSVEGLWYPVSAAGILWYSIFVSGTLWQRGVVVGTLWHLAVFVAGTL